MSWLAINEEYRYFDYSETNYESSCVIFQVANDTEVKAQIRLQFRDITGQKCMAIRSILATQKVMIASQHAMHAGHNVVRLSAHLSHSGIVLKWMYVSSQFLDDLEVGASF